MAVFSIPNIRIAGLSACVPKEEASNYDYKWISPKEREIFIKTTGVEKKRMAKKGTTTSDLCFVSAEKLIEELKWDKNEIQLLVFVSQSRDYLIPATSCILQDRLGLPKTCIALDVNLGCSGFVYGLSVLSSLMSVSKLKKGLLLAGDISTLTTSYKDKSAYPLFGDAGTATALELCDDVPNMSFNLQTDGSGYNAIIIPDGGFRSYISKKSFNTTKFDKGIIRNKINVALDGYAVFNFSLREVTPNIKDLLTYTSETTTSFDYFIFHQANKLINETISKKLKLEKQQVPYSLHKYGNTSSASIPLTIVSELKEEVKNKKLKMLFSGFGVGLSWGSVSVETNKIVCTDVLEY